jgi:hypothetical protein
MAGWLFVERWGYVVDPDVVCVLMLKQNWRSPPADYQLRDINERKLML